MLQYDLTQPPYDEREGKRYIDQELGVLLPRWIEAVASGTEQPFFPGVSELQICDTPSAAYHHPLLGDRPPCDTDKEPGYRS
jgi:hypothetical protein